MKKLEDQKIEIVDGIVFIDGTEIKNADYRIEMSSTEHMPRNDNKIRLILAIETQANVLG